MKTIYYLAISIPKSMASIFSGEKCCSLKLPGVGQAGKWVLERLKPWWWRAFPVPWGPTCPLLPAGQVGRALRFLQKEGSNLWSRLLAPSKTCAAQDVSLHQARLSTDKHKPTQGLEQKEEALQSLVLPAPPQQKGLKQAADYSFLGKACNCLNPSGAAKRPGGRALLLLCGSVGCQTGLFPSVSITTLIHNCC